MALTIKELADQLAVSKTAIRKHMDDKFRSTYTIKQGNKILIKDEGAEILRGQFKETEGSSENTTETAQKPSAAITNRQQEKTNHSATDLLAEQLNEQRKQIEEKDKQIRELHQLLDQSQRLQLDVQNKLKQLQNKTGNSAETKAIEGNLESTTQSKNSTTDKPASDNIPDSYQPQSTTDGVSSAYQSAPKRKKHWWQFGR